MRENKSLYHEVVAITEDYIGNAAGPFIDHQIENHLHKSAETLRMSDMPILVMWSRMAMALLIHNEEMVKEFTDRLTALTLVKS